MSIRPAFTSTLAERTTSPDSILGSIAASLNLPVEDGAASLIWTRREAIASSLVSKFPVIDFHLHRAGHLTNRIAADAREVADRGLTDPFPVSPPCMVMARAALMLTAERSMQAGVGLLEHYGHHPRPGYPDEQDARIDALRPYWPHITPSVAELLEDWGTVEPALARLVGIDRGRFRAELELGKSTVRDLLQGTKEWSGRQQVWLIWDALVPRAEELKPFLARDEAVVATARPALVALAWQLWPDLQPWIEATSRWIQVTPDGDPRLSWRDGWDGYDPDLNPEGYESG